MFKLAEIQQRFKKNPDQARELLQTLLNKYPHGDMKKKAEDLLAQMSQEAPAVENPPLENPVEILPLEEKKATPTSRDRGQVFASGHRPPALEHP